MSRDENTQAPAPVVLMWSGGKDAVLAFEAIAAAENRHVDTLLTTVVEDVETVTVHGTPLELIRDQAEALGCALHVMRVPPSPSNSTYEERFERTLAPLIANGLSIVATGDLFLDDIRAYRIRLFNRVGVEPWFPIWERDSAALANRFIERGYRAVVTSVDTEQLDASFVGRPYDTTFLADLPDGTDPCGENGEFHTFVSDGPVFRHPVSVHIQETRGSGRMHYARLRRP